MTEGSPTMDSSADPKVQLQGVRLPNLLLELSNQIPGRTDKEVITCWRISDRCAEQCVDAMLKIDKELKVLKDAISISPQMQNIGETEIYRKVKERTDWSMSFLHSLARDGQSGRSLQAQIEVLQSKAKKDEATIRRIKQAEQNLKVRNEVLEKKAQQDEATIRRIEQAEQNLKVGIEVLEKKAQQDEATIRSLQNLCNETTNYYRRLQEEVRTLESESRKDTTIKQNLRENLLGEGIRYHREKSRMEEAHRHGLCLLPTAGVVSESCKLQNPLEKNQPGTLLRTANSTSLAAGGQNEDTNFSPNLENKMEPETEPRDRGDVVQNETMLQKPKDSSSNFEKRMQPETEPRDREHLVQSETILQKPLDSLLNLEKAMDGASRQGRSCTK